jgi:hypothetical protein
MSPREAAEGFFKACAEENWAEFVKYWPMPGDSNRLQRVKTQLGGLELISLGAPFQTNSYPGWYVPYEVRFRPQEGAIAVSNTNAAKRYVVVAMYDNKLKLEQTMKWSTPPAVLPHNDVHAGMSPAEVAKAWADALASLDWDTMSKLSPPEDVQMMKQRCAEAQKRGVNMREQMPVIEVGQASWSAEHGAYLVKCRVTSHVKKWNLAIRNDNFTRRFMFDGGL